MVLLIKLPLQGVICIVCLFTQGACRQAGRRPGLITKHASPSALKGQLNPDSFYENIYANNLYFMLLNDCWKNIFLYLSFTF